MPAYCLAMLRLAQRERERGDMIAIGYGTICAPRLNTPAPYVYSNQSRAPCFSLSMIIKVLFRSQNTKYKNFINHLHGVLNVVKK